METDAVHKLDEMQMNGHITWKECLIPWIMGREEVKWQCSSWD